MGARKSVLVVDDDEAIRALLRKILEGAGYEVDERDSPVGLDDYVAKKPPHLILLDNLFPAGSGFGYLNERKRKTIPILMVSLIDKKKAVLTAMALGAQDYIIKPFKTPSVLRKVRKALRESTALALKYPHGEAPAADVLVKTPLLKTDSVAMLCDISAKLGANR